MTNSMDQVKQPPAHQTDKLDEWSSKVEDSLLAKAAQAAARKLMAQKASVNLLDQEPAAAASLLEVEAQKVSSEQGVEIKSMAVIEETGDLLVGTAVRKGMLGTGKLLRLSLVNTTLSIQDTYAV